MGVVARMPQKASGGSKHCSQRSVLLRVRGWSKNGPCSRSAQFENGDTLLRLPLLLINYGGETSHHLKVSLQFAALNWQDLVGRSIRDTGMWLLWAEDLTTFCLTETRIV